MRIYLDVSCLNRPFDDQSQPRIRLESEAVTLILHRIKQGDWHHVSSEMARLEIGAIIDSELRRQVYSLLPSPQDIIELSSHIFERAAELQSLSFKPADAVHVAAAEFLRVDVFLSCDDRLCRLAHRQRRWLSVKVLNPLAWLEEHDGIQDP